MARPTKLTPQAKQRIVAAIRAGNYAETSARSAGISPATYYRWLKRGADEEAGIYRELLDEVRLAEADAEVHAVATIRKAMPKDWRAALAYIERRYPDRWRRRDADSASPGASGDAERLDLKQLTDAELRQLRRIHRRINERSEGS
jgi:transposase-like protein